MLSIPFVGDMTLRCLLSDPFTTFRRTIVHASVLTGLHCCSTILLEPTTYTRKEIRKVKGKGKVHPRTGYEGPDGE